MSGHGHQDLPVIMDEQGGATSRWLFTPEELEQIASQGFIYVRQLGARDGVQPIYISTDPPIVPIDDAPRDDVLETGAINC